MSILDRSKNHSPISVTESTQAIERNNRRIFPVSVQNDPGYEPVLGRPHEMRIMPDTGKFMSGYSGCTVPKLVSDDFIQRPVTPVVGFQGYYRGRKFGKVGTVEVHRAGLSEEDITSRLNSGVRSNNQFTILTPPKQSYMESRFHYSADSEYRDHMKDQLRKKRTQVQNQMYFGDTSRPHST